MNGVSTDGRRSRIQQFLEWSLQNARMDEQQRVASFIQTHEMKAPPAYRLRDLFSELGEVAKDAAESTNYGGSPQGLDINADEIGDVLFALLALADTLDIDASEALDEALAKYDERITERDTASSGN
jgi:NTP pyrophosphatase (non-canonical NTP hydrolase)